MEYQQHKDAASVGTAHADKDTPLDTKRLADAVIELNISRKNVFIYPPGHAQVRRSIERAHEVLSKVYKTRSQITLGVVKDSLLVGEEYLDPKNPVYKEFAISLSQHDVAAVTFSQGLDKEELFCFLRVLSRKPEDVRAAGGIEKVMLDSNIPHIRIQAIDYSMFHLTEEKEISRKQAVEEKATGSEIWHNFVTHLVSGTLSTSGQGASLNDLTQIEPSELAQFINEHKLDTNAAIQSYEQIISEHLQETAESEQGVHESSDVLANLNRLLQELRPELRRQFLSVTFRQCSSQSTSGRTQALLDGFPDAMVVEMLSQANEEGREISPALLRLVQRISSTDDTVPAGLRDSQTDSSAIEPPPAFSAEDIQTLFGREDYEGYVDAEYCDVLKHLAEAPEIGVPTDEEAISAEDYMETLEDSHLELQICRALIGFMDEDIKDDEYRDFSRKLHTAVDEFLEGGEFTLLLEIFETLSRHSVEKPVPDIRSVAEEFVKKFKGPDFISKAVAAFDTWARQRGREASDFLLALGPEAIPELLNIYEAKECHDEGDSLFGLLCRFGQATASEAKKRLQDPRVHVVRNLLILISRTGSPEDAPSLRPLLEHEDQNVRTDVLQALLKFKDPWAVIGLRKAFSSRDRGVSSRAFFVAGSYQVADVAQDLVSMIKRMVLFKSGYQVNEEIIRALGQIGDPCAIPVLEKLARTTRTFYPKKLSHMKVVLFRSLAGYPNEYLTALLNIGKESSDERIQRTCRELMERK